MSIWKEIVLLFSGMSVITYAFLLVGVMFIIIEFFQPSRGVLGGCGLTLVIAGIVARMLGGGTLGMLFIMVFLVSVVCLLAHLLMMRSHKKDWLTHSLAIAITSTGALDSISYDFLLGLEGVASTDINPKGHMTINETNFLVTALTQIEKGARVKVEDVQGDNIFVIGMPAIIDQDKE